MITPADYVRFAPKSGHWNSVVECPLCANKRHFTFRSFDCVGMQTLTRTADILRSQAHHHDSRLFDQSSSAKSSRRMLLLPADLEFLLGARTDAARNDQHPIASRTEAISSQHFLRC